MLAEPHDGKALAPAEAVNRYKLAPLSQVIASDALPVPHARLLDHLGAQLRVPGLELDFLALKMITALEKHIATTYAEERKAAKASKPKAKQTRTHADTVRVRPRARADNHKRNESKPNPATIRSKEMISESEDEGDA